MHSALGTTSSPRCEHITSGWHSRSPGMPPSGCPWTWMCRLLQLCLELHCPNQTWIVACGWASKAFFGSKHRQEKTFLTFCGRLGNPGPLGPDRPPWQVGGRVVRLPPPAQDGGGGWGDTPSLWGGAQPSLGKKCANMHKNTKNLRENTQITPGNVKKPQETCRMTPNLQELCGIIEENLSPKKMNTEKIAKKMHQIAKNG